MTHTISRDGVYDDDDNDNNTEGNNNNNNYIYIYIFLLAKEQYVKRHERVSEQLKFNIWKE
jgi:hypothetical protein